MELLLMQIVWFIVSFILLTWFPRLFWFLIIWILTWWFTKGKKQAEARQKELNKQNSQDTKQSQDD